MNLQGLWTVSFSSAEEAHQGITVREDINRGGTLVLIDGRVYGGGVSYFFTGSYTSKASAIEMHLTATRYNDIVSGQFGNQAVVKLQLSGSVAGETMVLKGHPEGDESRRLDLMMVRRSQID